MTHSTEKFKLVNKQGRETEVVSRPYTFEIAEVLEKRFGKSTLDKFYKTHQLDKRITLKDCEEDFPKLLTGDFTKINIKKCSYDELIRVYFFFISFELNAWLRQLELNRETAALTLEKTQEILDSLPKNISQS